VESGRKILKLAGLMCLALPVATALAADTDIDRGRQTIDVVGRPLAGAAAPAEFAAARRVDDARGAIPWGA